MVKPNLYQENSLGEVWVEWLWVPLMGFGGPTIFRVPGEIPIALHSEMFFLTKHPLKNGGVRYTHTIHV